MFIEEPGKWGSLKWEQACGAVCAGMDRVMDFSRMYREITLFSLLFRPGDRADGDGDGDDQRGELPGEGHLSS